MITIWVPKRLVEIDLYNVAACSPQQLAQLSEHSYAQRVNYAAEKIRMSGAKIVMLTGPSASGKTTSAHCIARALQQQGTPAQVGLAGDSFGPELVGQRCQLATADGFRSHHRIRAHA